MAELTDCIRAAIQDERYFISDHAHERLRERRIPGWQVIAGAAQARLLRECPDAAPNPTIELEEVLPDGTAINAVWAWLRYNKTA